MKHSQQKREKSRPAKARASSSSVDGSTGALLNSNGKKRRSQVKIACIHCKKACKKCDDVRPCTRYVSSPATFDLNFPLSHAHRCVRIGLADNCIDAPRKERKKGFKRGPYNKGRRDSVDSIGSNEEWALRSAAGIYYLPLPTPLS